MNNLSICTIPNHDESKIISFCLQEGCEKNRRMCESCLDDHKGHWITTLNAKLEKSAMQNFKINYASSQHTNRANIDNKLSNIIGECVSISKTFEKFKERCLTNHLYPMSEIILNSFKEDSHILGAAKIREGNLNKDELNMMAKGIRCLERQYLRSIPLLQQATKIMSEELIKVMKQSFGAIGNQLEKVQNSINKFSLFQANNYPEMIKDMQKRVEEQAIRKREQIRLRQQDQRNLLEKSILDSKIIQDWQLIHSFFTNQKVQFKLLYRASENNFSATEFHKKCDNIPNTLVIAQTQFGKVIGGYTPLAWNATRNNTYATDSTSKSFLFSITNKEKYPITDTSTAIVCNPVYGPTFGEYDLHISNKSNTNQNASYANFPRSYNNGKYTQNQNSQQAFIGAAKKGYCKILEWQVYEVQLRIERTNEN